MSREERRNTLSGTPYWMAPEIISNKNGKCPYDEKIDIWALGITCIELAEKDPPLAELHPMRALMQIPMRESPSFKNPKKWSPEFQDFIKQCLVKDPSKRASATDLLRHPFIIKIDVSQNPLPSLIQETRDVKHRVAVEESMGDENDSSLEDGEAKQADNPDAEDVEESSAQEPVTIKPNKAPTVRSTLNKPNVTKRELEFQQAKIMNKNLVLQQLKALSEQRSQDIKEFERLKKAHKRESTMLEQEYRQNQQKLERDHQAKTSKLLSQHNDLYDATIRHHHNDAKSLSRNSLNEDKQKLKDLKEKQKADLNEYREKLKSKRKEKEKEFKDIYKKKKEEHKALPKKDRATAEKELKLEQAEHTKTLDHWENLSVLRFTQSQSIEKLLKEQEVTIHAIDHTNQVKETQKIKTIEILSKQLHEKQLNEWTCENEVQEMETNFLKRRMALQVVHLEKENALNKQQLERVQVVEKNQQIKLLKSDLRAKQKEWAKKKQGMLKEFLKTQKEFTQQNKKEMNKNDIRAVIVQKRNSFDKMIKENDQTLRETQEREIQDEETWLSQHHNQQREHMANDQKQELEIVSKEHAKTLAQHEESQKNTMDALGKRHFDEKLKHLKSTQKQTYALISKQVSEKLEVMNQHMEEFNHLAKSNQTQLTELMDTQEDTQEVKEEAITESQTEVSEYHEQLAQKLEEYEQSSNDMLAQLSEEQQLKLEEMKANGIHRNLYDESTGEV